MMNYIVSFFFILSTLLFPWEVNAQFTTVEKSYSSVANLLHNPGAEQGKSKVTASAGTFTVTTTTANVGSGSSAFGWDAAASGNTLSWTAITVPYGLAYKNLAISCNIQTPSGTATHELQLYDGTNIVSEATVTSSTSYARTTINGPAGAAGSTIQLRLYANANEPQIYIDDCILMDASFYNVGVGAVATEWVSYTPTNSTTTNVSTNAAKWRRVGDSIQVEGSIVYSGATDSGALTVSLPSGYTINTGKMSVTSQTHLGTAHWSDSGTGFFAMITRYNSTTTVAFYQDGAGGSFNGTSIAASDEIHYRFTAPIVSWDVTSTAVRPENLNWYIDATMDGGNPDLGTSNQTSFVEITNASLTLKPQSGSQAVGVMCSSTNAATAPSTNNTTCSAGDESVGINFTIPVAGSYEVCWYASHYMNNGASGSASVTYQIIETPTNAQTLTLEGGTRVSSSLSTQSIQLTHPMANCSVFNWSSSGTKGVRVMYEQAITATVTNNLILADANTSNGQRNMRWTVRPWNGNLATPLLVGSITSSSTGLERMERATIVADASFSLGSDVTQSGSWIASGVRNSTGDYTLTFTSGVFTSTPVCSVSVVRALDNTRYIVSAWIRSVSSSNIRIEWAYEDDQQGTIATAIANVDDSGTFHLTCMGPR